MSWGPYVGYAKRMNEEIHLTEHEARAKTMPLEELQGRIRYYELPNSHKSRNIIDKIIDFLSSMDNAIEYGVNKRILTERLSTQ